MTSRSGAGQSETLTYDSLNRLTNSTKQGAYTYFPNGNIRNKAVVGSQTTPDYGYDPIHPHAVQTAFGYSMGYDANGNLSSRTGNSESWDLRYAGFDKPRWMTKTTNGNVAGSEFLYDANHSRTVQLGYDQVDSAGVPSHYAWKRVYGLGPTLEANYQNDNTGTGAPTWTLKKIRVYLPGPDGVVGTREFDPALPQGQQETDWVYHYDHLGSIDVITPFGSTAVATNSSGQPGQYSEDAWGQRRNPATWSGPPSGTDTGGFNGLTPRGFTGHEMLDNLGLVHMNGRIYDPLLGRMLSADPLISKTSDLQAYNRYSYVLNRPLTMVDPSGFDPAFTPDVGIFQPLKANQEVEAAKLAAPATAAIVAVAATDGLAAPYIAAAAPGYLGTVGTGILAGTVGDLAKQGTEMSLGTRSSISGSEVRNSAVAGGLIAGAGRFISSVWSRITEAAPQPAVTSEVNPQTAPTIEVHDGGAAPKAGPAYLDKTLAQRAAGKLQNLSSSQRPNTVAVIESENGAITVGTNGTTPSNPQVQAAIAATPPNQFAGQCAEPNAVGRALEKGRSVAGGEITTANVRGPYSVSGVQGTPKPPCSVCERVLKFFGLSNGNPP